jgi:hypothetical protein
LASPLGSKAITLARQAIKLGHVSVVDNRRFGDRLDADVLEWIGVAKVLNFHAALGFDSHRKRGDSDRGNEKALTLKLLNPVPNRC